MNAKKFIIGIGIFHIKAQNQTHKWTKSMLLIPTYFLLQRIGDKNPNLVTKRNEIQQITFYVLIPRTITFHHWLCTAKEKRNFLCETKEKFDAHKKPFQ